MDNHKKIPILCLIVLCVFLVACGKTGAKDIVNDTEIQTEDSNIIDNFETTETEKEVTYKEYDGYFRVSDKSYYDNTYIDDTILDWSSWERIGKNVYIESSINIYNEKKAMVGYTKSNIEVIYVAVNGEWSNLAIGENGSSVYVRTDELNLAISTENDIVAKDTETTPKAEEEPTYTVREIDKTMYAKQSVNLRSGPSTDFEKVGSLTTNQEVTVTGIADTGWYRINYNGGVAFVSNNYLSDTKVEVAPSDDGGDTNEDENDSEEEYTPPTDDDTEDDFIYIEPEEPKYTVDEVISIVRSTLESGGMMWSVDYATSKGLTDFNPNLGMGWGMDWVPMDDPYTYANSLLEGFQYQGFDLYYIEYQYVENNKVVFKTYYGTQW